jgi:hypothetical protein
VQLAAVVDGFLEVDGSLDGLLGLDIKCLGNLNGVRPRLVGDKTIDYNGIVGHRAGVNDDSIHAGRA